MRGLLFLLVACTGSAVAQMRMPSMQEMEQMQRQAQEMQRLTEEVMRLRRLGRAQEADAAARRLDEMMGSGFLGSMMRGSGAEMPSLSGALSMERRLGEDVEAYLPRALFVKAEALWLSEAHQEATRRLPMAVHERMQEAYGRAGRKDWAGAHERMREAAAAAGERAAPVIREALGRIEMMRGDWRAALGHFRAAAELAQRGGEPALLPQILWQQAQVQAELGAPREAVGLCERALELVGPASPDRGAALNNLGVALHQSGDVGGAIRAYGAALGELRRAAAGAGHLGPMYTSSLPLVGANLGLAHWQRGDTAQALQAFRAALDERAIWETQNDPFQTERAALAKANALAVELHAVMTLERQAGVSGSSMALQTLLERKGAVLERQARALAGFRREAQAAQQGPGFFGSLFESQADRMQRDQANRQRAADRELLAEYEAVAAERSTLASRPAPGAAAQAAQREKIAELDARLQTMQREMQMQDMQRTQQAEQPDFQALARQGGRDPARMMREMTAATERQEQTRRERISQSRESLFARVQARVPAEALLVEMVKYTPMDPRADLPEEKRWGRARYGAWLIAAQGDPAYVDFGEAEPLERLVLEFRRALAHPERVAGRELGRRLDEAVMRPIRAVAARSPGVRVLYVAPEGALNLAPLAALVDEDGRYLVERFTLTYLSSGRDLLVLGRNDPPRSPPLILADPVFDSSTDAQGRSSGTRSLDFRATHWERLPGTAAEAEALKRLMPDAVLVTGAQATETAAKRASGPRILHIATHGFFLDDAPAETTSGSRSLQVEAAGPKAEDPMLRSGLVFAGVNALRSGDDDGVLTALEASALDLRGTRLVVLSACETGLGEVRNGEGVFGLRRAFVVAGAETLLMSLWQVADEATKELMTAYYARLARGEPRAEALRQAQLELLKQPKTAAPFYWAAFISSGEAGPLK